MGCRLRVFPAPFRYCLPSSWPDLGGRPRLRGELIAFIPKTILPGGRARLQQGERVRILTSGPQPVQVTFQPVRYHELHPSIVPADIRNRPGYLYYWLCLKMAYTPCCLHEEPGFFHELFRLTEDEP